jgi:hypothetical protein
MKIQDPPTHVSRIFDLPDTSDGTRSCRAVAGMRSAQRECRVFLLGEESHAELGLASSQGVML